MDCLFSTRVLFVIRSASLRPTSLLKGRVPNVRRKRHVSRCAYKELPLLVRQPHLSRQRADFPQRLARAALAAAIGFATHRNALAYWKAQTKKCRRVDACFSSTQIHRSPQSIHRVNNKTSASVQVCGQYIPLKTVQNEWIHLVMVNGIVTIDWVKRGAPLTSWSWPGDLTGPGHHFSPVGTLRKV